MAEHSAQRSRMPYENMLIWVRAVFALGRSPAMSRVSTINNGIRHSTPRSIWAEHRDSLVRINYGSLSGLGSTVLIRFSDFERRSFPVQGWGHLVLTLDPAQATTAKKRRCRRRYLIPLCGHILSTRLPGRVEHS